MTTKEFLSENRNEVISFYNSNIKSESNISLKDFMIALMKDYRQIAKSRELYSDWTLMSNMFELQSKIGINAEIGVTYTKPYSESNHAKAVNYFGKEKVQLMSNAK